MRFVDSKRMAIEGFRCVRVLRWAGMGTKMGQDVGPGRDLP